MLSDDPTTGWQAELELRFQRRGPATVLTGRRHQGPLVVQKPFYPEGEDCCHVYVVHPPAGVAGGDALRLGLDLGPGAHALVTTPGAAKFYRSDGRPARALQNFAVAPGATLEWLPQETIVHSGALASLETTVNLAPGARFAGWEIVCLGLAAANAPFAVGSFTQGLRLTRDGRPALNDRCLLAGGSPALLAPWGLDGRTVSGLFAATLDPGGHIPELPTGEGAAFAVVDGLVIGRFLGDQAWKAREIFTTAWSRWREAQAGRRAQPPRIWNT